MSSPNLIFTNNPGGARRVPRVPKKIYLREDTVERVRYWADKAEYGSMNEFIAMAVEEKVARINGDYDLPVLEIQRLNQLVDEIRAVSVNMANLEKVIINGFDSLLGLTRGDSYLQDADEGELDTDYGKLLLGLQGADLGEPEAGYPGVSGEGSVSDE